MLVRVMKSVGHVCDEAADGAQAVALVKQAMLVGGTAAGTGTGTGTGALAARGPGSRDVSAGCYDAILMDSVMPVLDGPGATVRIRQMGYTGKVFGVTGNAMPSDVAHFVASGADEVRRGRCVSLRY